MKEMHAENVNVRVKHQNHVIHTKCDFMVSALTFFILVGEDFHFYKWRATNLF